VVAPGVLANDADPDGAALTALLVNGPSNGALNLNPDGSFSYIPANDFNGDASFSYRAVDTKGGSTIGTTTLIVSPINDPPDATDDAYSVPEDDTLTVSAPGTIANDSDLDADVLQAVLVSSPANGVLHLVADGSFSYVPNGNFNGIDTFIYRVEDGHGGSDSAKVTLMISLVNDLPIAMQDDFLLAEDDTLLVPTPGVLANDTDTDGGQLSVLLADGPANGTVDLNPDGSFAYVPQANFHGHDSFTYSLEDNQGGAVTGSVTLTVSPVNDAPAALNDQYDVVVDEMLSVSAPGVLANDSDLEGDELSAMVMSAPSNGTLVLNPDGSFVYAPTLGFVGTDSFTYGVTDTSGSASIGTVHIMVNADEIKHEQTVAGGSSGKDVVKTSAPIDGIEDHLYIAAISTKPYRKATELTGLGLIWTHVREQCAGRNQTGVEIWRAIGSPVANDVVTASLSSAPKNAAISVSRYSGIDAANPMGSIISGNTRGLDGVCSRGSDKDVYSFNFANTQDGAVVFAAVGMRNKTHTPGGTFRELVEISQGGGGSGAGLAVMDSLMQTAGPIEVAGSFNDDVDWALIAVELRPPSRLSKSTVTRERSISDNNVAIPSSFELGQNFPNPFNPTTTISFSVPKTSELNLAIYNMRGQRVRLLVSGSVKAGRHRITWDGRNDQERKVASGIYVYRLETKNFTAQRKLILAK
ncbi:tandem-95 repeat protein, partial [bacterium]|nr:tandem-95 repeat protein [bacterium]